MAAAPGPSSDRLLPLPRSGAPLANFLADLTIILVGAVARALGGGIGWAVVALSFAFRVMLVPLTAIIARRSIERRRALAAIRPEVARIEREYADDPNRRAAAIGQLEAEEGFRRVEPAGLLSLAVQLPVACGLLAAAGRHRRHAAHPGGLRPAAGTPQ